jgi:hypothetical protein
LAEDHARQEKAVVVYWTTLIRLELGEVGVHMLSRPTFVVWFLSTILAGVVVLMTYAGVTVPVLSPIVAGHTFEVLLVAYVILWLGTVFTGL